MKTLIPTSKQWRNWSLPSKLTAIGALLALFTTAVFIIEKTYPYIRGIPELWSDKDVSLEIEFQNNWDKELELYGRGEIYYWYPGGSSHRVYAFELAELAGNKNVGDILLPKKKSMRGVVNLLPRDVARGYLEQGHMSISLFFKHKDGKTTHSPNIGFTRSNLRKGYIEVEFGQSEVDDKETKKLAQPYSYNLNKVVSDASSLKILKGCIRLGGSFRTATEVSEEICDSQSQIDGAFSDSVKYIEATGCAQALIYSDKDYKGSVEEFDSC